MLSHLEFEQFKRALNHLRSESNSQYSTGPVKREDVIEVLLPYVEGFTPPNPHPVVDKPVGGSPA